MLYLSLCFENLLTYNSCSPSLRDSTELMIDYIDSYNVCLITIDLKYMIYCFFLTKLTDNRQSRFLLNLHYTIITLPH